MGREPDQEVTPCRPTISVVSRSWTHSGCAAPGALRADSLCPRARWHIAASTDPSLSPTRRRPCSPSWTTRAGRQPAGLAAFARSRGGHLHNDPASGRLATVQRLELLILDAVTLEQGVMHQNLALMAEAMGLGGFPSFAMHEFGWFEALGFRMGSMPATRYLGGGRLLGLLARLAGRDLPVPYPIGLERGGEVLLRAMSPPYFASMADAVRHVVDRKFGARGCFREPGADRACKRGDEIAAAVPPVSDWAQGIQRRSGSSAPTPNRSMRRRWDRRRRG